MSHPDDELVSIGAFAQASRLTVKALRHYHAVGVLPPAWVDPASGYRHYRWSQLADVLCITTLRDLDVPLDRIARHMVDGIPLNAVLREERATLEVNAARVRRALAIVNALADEERFPTVTVDAVDWDDHHVLAKRASTTGHAMAGTASRLIAILIDQASGVGIDVVPPITGTYPLALDGAVSLVVQLPVSPVAASTGSALDGVTLEVFPGGPFARAVHVGPHATLPITYHGLLQDLRRRNIELSGPVYERYLDDPATTEPALVRTEVLHRLPEAAR